MKTADSLERAWPQSIRKASLPFAVMTRGMQHRGNDDEALIFNHLKNNPVGESGRIPPADVFYRVTPGIQQRIFCKRIPYENNFLHKVGP